MGKGTCLLNAAVDAEIAGVIVLHADCTRHFSQLSVIAALLRDARPGSAALSEGIAGGDTFTELVAALDAFAAWAKRRRKKLAVILGEYTFIEKFAPAGTLGRLLESMQSHRHVAYVLSSTTTTWAPAARASSTTFCRLSSWMP